MFIFIAGCNSVQSVFNDLSPYEEYVKALQKAELQDTPMVTDWLATGKAVFYDSIIVDLPFSESGYFEGGKPDARSYQFKIKAGQILSIKALVQTQSGGTVFMDLFTREGQEWERVAFADSIPEIEQEFDNSSTCLLRIQPELLVDVYYGLSITTDPALRNPVSTATNSSIGSIYGDPRDGGGRSHEGIDIFAPRGTPVIAPTDGYISRVGHNRLGGKVIWMRDRHRGHSYYFAHLDSQLVSAGTRVIRGDTLGLVGNTGNARTTPPHLHFGIYQYGSRDPLYYVQQTEALATIAGVDTTLSRKPYKVNTRILNVRSAPNTSGEIIDKIEKQTYLEIVGKSNDWWRIILPNQKQGYVYCRLIEPVENGTPGQLSHEKFLLSRPVNDAVPVRLLPGTSQIAKLAQFEGFDFVRTQEGTTGWLKR